MAYLWLRFVLHQNSRAEELWQTQRRSKMLYGESILTLPWKTGITTAMIACLGAHSAPTSSRANPVLPRLIPPPTLRGRAFKSPSLQIRKLRLVFLLMTKRWSQL